MVINTKSSQKAKLFSKYIPFHRKRYKKQKPKSTHFERDKQTQKIHGYTKLQAVMKRTCDLHRFSFPNPNLSINGLKAFLNHFDILSNLKGNFSHKKNTLIKQKITYR